MITKGVYSATCSILREDCSLNVDATIAHAASSINNGLHGAIFFGSTGQSQLIDLNSKKSLISKAANHKLRKALKKKRLYLVYKSKKLMDQIFFVRMQSKLEYQ